jgi:aminopeptidase N
MPTSRRARRAPLVAGLVTVLLGAGVVTPATAAPPPDRGDRGIGDRYFPLDGNGGLDVVSYRIHDRYRFGQGELSGRTRLTIDATEDLSSFTLDFLLPVRAVKVDGERASEVGRDKHDLTIVPQTPIAEGERFTVTVSYAGRPDEHGYLGERNWLADRREVVAMNQPHMAPWWFPSNDHPSDKALMDISITVPRGKQVFANGERVSRTPRGGLVTHRYRAPEPMATYLAMFAAGDFQVERGTRDGLPWTAVVSEQLPADARRANLALMRQTPRVVAGLEEDLGPYPFSTVGGLVTGLDVGFALENQTLPTYPATGRGYTWLVVHEIAHQWFGDSVALQRWRDIWLNEGAASFMEVRWEETHGGISGERWLRRQYDARPEASTFWDLEIGNPGADHIFDGAVYTRGAMTFQALRTVIGERDFWELLQRWVSEREGGNGTRGAFVRLAEEVSGRDLDAFFRVWLDVGRKPADVAANGLG